MDYSFFKGAAVCFSAGIIYWRVPLSCLWVILPPQTHQKTLKLQSHLKRKFVPRQRDVSYKNLKSSQSKLAWVRCLSLFQRSSFKSHLGSFGASFKCGNFENAFLVWFFFSWSVLRRAQRGPCVLQLQTHLGQRRTCTFTSRWSRTTRWRCRHLSIQLSLSNLWDHDVRRRSSANVMRAGIKSVNDVYVQINVALRHKAMFVRWIIIYWIHFMNIQLHW